MCVMGKSIYHYKGTGKYKKESLLKPADAEEIRDLHSRGSPLPEGSVLKETLLRGSSGSGLYVTIICCILSYRKIPILSAKRKQSKFTAYPPIASP